MNRWKQCLLSGYYHATWPARVCYAHALAARGRAPAIVLFYHRVADDAASPWTCSNSTFKRQIDWLADRFEMVSLAEAQRRIRSGENQRTCVTITFDDGYAANCDFALPLLVERKIPCTYFVSSRIIFDGRPFPHDVAAGRPLAVNTPRQIVELARAGIEIGAHTRTHADLGRITDRMTLANEMLGSRDDLESLIGGAVPYFAFPFGQFANLSGVAFEMARDAGFAGVCSAYGGYNFPGDDPFHLQRIHVDDDLVRLQNWTTLDPRKLLATRRYTPDAIESEAEVPQGAAL